MNVMKDGESPSHGKWEVIEKFLLVLQWTAAGACGLPQLVSQATIMPNRSLAISELPMRLLHSWVVGGSLFGDTFIISD
jgi:hypothetical protein